MRRSIRWRLQIWYAVVLVTVVGGLTGFLYIQERTTRLEEVDRSLEAVAATLDVHLRRFPPHELEGGSPEAMRPPPPAFGPPPGPLNRERLMAELSLPERMTLGPSHARQELYFAIWRADGSLLKSEGTPASAEMPSPSPSRPAEFVSRAGYREIALLGPRRTRILVGAHMAEIDAHLVAFAARLALAGAVVLAVGLAGGWLISSRILRPVAAIARTASSISAANLSERIDTEEVDQELAALAQVLNDTFARLQAAFEQQARFTADASHELRTPLAILLTHLDLALSRPRTPEEYCETLTTCRQAALRMTGLIDGLLILARADAGKLALDSIQIDLAALVEEHVAMLRPLAESRSVSFRLDLQEVAVTGDPLRLGQVVTNLLSNAIHYNHPGGEVRVRLTNSDGGALLAVEDDGEGIPEEDREHIFDRFYRVDRARSRASGGNGLGLAISHSIVEAHGGTIGFESTVGRGSVFWVRLPAVQPESPIG